MLTGARTMIPGTVSNTNASTTTSPAFRGGAMPCKTMRKPSGANFTTAPGGTFRPSIGGPGEPGAEGLSIPDPEGP